MYCSALCHRVCRGNAISVSTGRSFKNYSKYIIFRGKKRLSTLALCHEYAFSVIDPPTTRGCMYTILVRDHQVYARHLYQENGDLHLIVNLRT